MRGLRSLLAGATLLALGWPVAAAPTCGIKGGLPPRTLAIALAVNGRRDDALRAASGDAFVEGFVAYISRDYDLAIERMTAYATQAQAMRKPRERSDALARAGYWASEALERKGDARGAAEMRDATTAQRGTFYALLIDSRKAMPGRKGYPTPSVLYTDPRAEMALVYAIGREESGFNPSATSGAGAHGAMQVLHSTAERVTSWVGMHADANKVDHDLDYNVAVGSTYLGWLMERYRGYAPLAAAGYNAGEGCADAWVARLGDPRSAVDPLVWAEAIPIKETRDYVQHVMSSYIVYLSAGS